MITQKNQQFHFCKLHSQRIDIKCNKYTKCDPKTESNNNLWLKNPEVHIMLHRDEDDDNHEHL